MRVLVHNTRADFTALAECTIRLRLGRAYKFMRHTYPRICFVLGLLYLAFLIYVWKAVPFQILLQGFPTIFILLFCPWIFSSSNAMNFSLAKRRKRFGVPYTLELREDGIQTNQDGKENFVAWSTLRYVSHDDHSLFLLRSGWNNASQGYVIPDSSFSSPEEAQSFSKAALDFWLQFNSSHAPIAAP